jgi:uncharacterized protein YjdB
MNHLKHLQFLLLLLVCTLLNAQCPPSIPGYLSGTKTNILVTDTTPAPVFTITPSGLPNTEFILIQKDSIAADGLGPKLINSSLDGRVVPGDYGLTTCNEICILPFSYDLNQLKTLVDTLYGSFYLPAVSCCDAAAGFFIGFCDSLASHGINSGADISNLNDVITMMSIFAGTTDGSLSLNNLLGTIDQVNSIMTLFGPCAAGMTELCYSVMNSDSAMDCYVVTLQNSATSVDITQDTLKIAPGDTSSLTGSFLPGTATDSLFWYVSDSGSSISVNSSTGLITAGSIADTAWVVAQAMYGCARDTVLVIVDPTVAIKSFDMTVTPLKVTPNPFSNRVQVEFYADEGAYIIQFIGITGQIHFNQNQYLTRGNQQIEIETGNIPEGYYFLRITGSKTQGTQAVFKN